MGYISNLVGSVNTKDSFRESPTNRGEGRRLWQEVFGATNKEEPHKPVNRTDRFWSGHSSLTSSNLATKRLIEAFRSNSPGTWTDNRWEQSNHLVGITYVSVHRKCEQLAQAEFQVFVKDDNSPDGKRPVPKGHDGYKLIDLLERPNRRDSFGDLLYCWTQQLDLTGSALTWMVPNKLGIPYELYPIPTATAIPQPVVNEEYPDGYYRIQPFYPYGPFSSSPTPASSVGAAIDARWMITFKYPHPLVRYDGYAPLTALRLHLDEIEAMDRSRWYAMKRGINPSAVLQFDSMENAMPLPEEELDRIHAEFENTQYGPENTGRLYVSTPGSKLEPFGQRPIDMDYQAGWDQLVSFAMAGFGITKPAAGMIEDSSYSTLFATLKQLHLLTLNPICRRYSAGLTRFLAPYFGDDLIIEIRCQRVDDHDLVSSRVDTLMKGQAITKGEVRKLMDLPLFGDERDDEIAGEPKQQQPGGQGGGIPGMPDMSGGAGAGKEEAVVTGGNKPPSPLALDEKVKPIENDDKTGSLEVERIRPKPHELGRQALGPRKMLVNSNGKY